MSDTKAVIAELRAMKLGGVADVIESQAKELARVQTLHIGLMKNADNMNDELRAELAEAQARVVVLMDFVRLVNRHFVEPANADVYDLINTKKFEQFLDNISEVDGEIGKRCKELLASTDTAVQTLREKWTPVSERLPEPDTYVIVYNGKWCGLGKWVSGQYVEDIERWQDEHTEFIELLGPKISHWQPLPEPPKEKK